MYRLTALAAAIAFAPAAFAAELDPGTSPAMMLIQNGLAGAGNELANPPPIKIMAGELPLTLGKSKLADITAALGSEVNTIGEGGGAFGWVCYASYPNPDGLAELTWFASKDTEDGTLPLTDVAIEYATDVPPACYTLAAPLVLSTGALTLGATQAQLEAAYGAKPEMEADGTVAWFFGSEKLGDGINVRRTQIKYRVIDGKAAAASAGTFYEME